MGRINWICAILLVLVGYAANGIGLFFNVLFVFLIVMVPMRFAALLWRACRRSLVCLPHRASWRELHRGFWFQFGNQCLFWFIVVLTLESCIVPAQFAPEEYSAIRLIMWLGTAAMLVMNCFPGARIYMSMNAALAIGTGFMAAEMVAVRWPVSEGEGVVLAAPVKGEWLVMQGGVSSLFNHHYPIASQRDAIDLVRTLKGRSQLGDKTKLNSFPTWGEKVYSPVAGTIVRADVAHEDNAIGATDRKNLAGNHLVIDMGGGRFVMLAHLQKNSVLVKVGDTVREGDVLGRCGNSGNSSEPHLHIQVQSKADLFDGDVRTYPILFREVVRTRAGRSLQDGPVTVRRNDRIFSDPGVPR